MPTSRGAAEIAAIAANMRMTLSLGRNARKGHWRKMTWWQLWRGLLGELFEFAGALWHLRRCRDPDRLGQLRTFVASEGVDVCNQVMFMIDKAGGFK